jgi:hypothetical protein
MRQIQLDEYVSNGGEPVKSDPAETRYGDAVDVKRAADLYAQGWTLRQIAAELGLTESTVSFQLRRAGVTLRRGGLPAPPAPPASTQQILELRDRGLTRDEMDHRFIRAFADAGWPANHQAKN